MNNSVKISLIIVGLYECILSLLHGIFEMLQGFTSTNGIFIYAISKINQGKEMWHGNFPAITILPNFLITGFCSILLSVLIFLYLFTRKNTKYNIYILIGLSILLLLFGGGFVPFFLLMITSFSSLIINKKFNYRENKVPKNIFKIIWIMSIFTLFFIAFMEWIIGYFVNDIMVKIGFILFLTGLLLPIFIIVTGMLNDIINKRA